ncbi:MAG: hypothetical protein P1Q69_04115 [Candidatus Thorarchaeota archaeon]|nr:hypothetical protein [Candidatus Thorarchaeota archaeon]
MDSYDTKINIDIDTNTIKYLLGELGIQTLTLIAQGCTHDEEIKNLSTITGSCLEVKIPLLETLNLITTRKGYYEMTPRGVTALSKITGWKA